MKKTFFIIVGAALLSGCTKVENKDVYQRLAEMESYKTEAEVTYISNKGEDVFETVQYAMHDGRYCIETTAPENYAGTSLVYDGKLVWQKTNGIDNKIRVTSNDPERSLLTVYSFLDNHSRSMENAVVTTSASPEGDCTVLSAEIPGGSKFLSEEKLWIDNNSGSPEKLTVYDAQGNEKIVVKFSGFRYNERIDDSKFSVSQ